MSELTKEQRAKIVQNMGLTIEAVFVPFSQSPNKAEKSPSLNWIVTVKRDDQDVLTTRYSAGCGHAPSYKQTFGQRTTADQEREAMVAYECEHGFPALGGNWQGREGYRVHGTRNPAKAILPDILDVLYSLASDADAIDYKDFEDWASSFGYDPDSRSAEKTYRACLDIGLKLRAALGDDGLRDLRNAFEGY